MSENQDHGEISYSRQDGAIAICIAILLVIINYGLSRILGIYFPVIVLPSGPLATIGLLVIISPRFISVFLSSEKKKYDLIIKCISWVFIIFGCVISIFVFAKLRGDF